MTTPANPQFPQPRITREALEIITGLRKERSTSIEQLTVWLTEQGFPMSYREYAAIEDGRTKAVPVDVVILAALYFEVPAQELFPMLDF